MSQWHLHDPASNNRLGPMDVDAARAQAARNPSLLAWKDGMGDWLPVRNIAELVDAVPGACASAPPPPPQQQPYQQPPQYREQGHDDRYYGSKPYKKNYKKSFLSELFD